MRPIQAYLPNAYYSAGKNCILLHVLDKVAILMHLCI